MIIKYGDYMPVKKLRLFTNGHQGEKYDHTTHNNNNHIAHSKRNRWVHRMSYYYIIKRQKLIERLKQFIVKHTGLKHYCHIHHGQYCNCRFTINESYDLDLFKIIKQIFTVEV